MDGGLGPPRAQVSKPLQVSLPRKLCLFVTSLLGDVGAGEDVKRVADLGGDTNVKVEPGCLVYCLIFCWVLRKANVKSLGI